MKEYQLLHEYPEAMVKIACRKCPRYGQYRKGNLIMKYGASHNLPSLLQVIAKCERHGNYSDWCGAYYLNGVNNPK